MTRRGQWTPLLLVGRRKKMFDVRIVNYAVKPVGSFDSSSCEGRQGGLKKVVE